MRILFILGVDCHDDDRVRQATNFSFREETSSALVALIGVYRRPRLAAPDSGDSRRDANFAGELRRRQPAVPSEDYGAQTDGARRSRHR